jgi:Ca2+-binding RTX toxin-like protein
VVDGVGGTAETIALTATSGDHNDAADGDIVNIEAVSAAGAGAGVTINLDEQSEDFAITGSTSADSLTGGSGNDTLVGGAANDALDGGAGTGDTASYAASASAVAVSLQAGTGTGGDAQGDTLTNIENLIGSGLDDSLTGSSVDNVLDGGAGNDTLLAGSGNDALIGGAGNDTLNGGANTDTASYASASAAVTVDLSIATAQNTGGAGTDTLSAIENLTGSAHDDTLTGNTLDNALNGGAGNDTLAGGTGNDTLTGGGGNDVFVFVQGDVDDVITDFTPGAAVGNVIDLSSWGFLDFADMQANVLFDDSGADLIIDFQTGDTLTLVGVDNEADLHANDFLFA